MLKLTKPNGTQILIKKSEIVTVEQEQGKTIIVLQKKTYTVKETVEDVERFLNESSDIRMALTVFNSIFKDLIEEFKNITTAQRKATESFKKSD